MSDYSEKVQKEYTDTHKKYLKEELDKVYKTKTAYTNQYGRSYLEIPKRPAAGDIFKKVPLGNLTDEQMAMILSKAQKAATKETKKKVFGADSVPDTEDDN